MCVCVCVSGFPPLSVVFPGSVWVYEALMHLLHDSCSIPVTLAGGSCCKRPRPQQYLWRCYSRDMSRLCCCIDALALILVAGLAAWCRRPGTLKAQVPASLNVKLTDIWGFELHTARFSGLRFRSSSHRTFTGLRFRCRTSLQV